MNKNCRDRWAYNKHIWPVATHNFIFKKLLYNSCDALCNNAIQITWKELAVMDEGMIAHLFNIRHLYSQTYFPFEESNDSSITMFIIDLSQFSPASKPTPWLLGVQDFIVLYAKWVCHAPRLYLKRKASKATCCLDNI